ncbi:MAG: sarcosine oxidase subunit gamma [Candidatus Saccharibacteria bacterium]|nr:sarcosine oxidase subunit gamma [Pseudorhodobacter sp.]
MVDGLHALTALGQAAPAVLVIGPWQIAERFDVALASIACRHGQETAFTAAAASIGVPLPQPARAQGGLPYGAFWVAPEMWFIEAPFASHEDTTAHLKPTFGEAASITEQTDAWVRFDVTGANLPSLFGRFSNLDIGQLPNDYASRTVIEHLGCYLVRRNAEDVTLYGPRSSARSLLHALEVTARSLL